MQKPLLPKDCQLRPALATDIGPIRRLVWSARLDPTQIRWSQFWVIEQEQTIVACGQLRVFPGAQELGSLVVKSTHRRQGLGTILAKHLIQYASQPLYLECLGQHLCQYYQQMGFQIVEWQALPRSLKRKFGLSRIAKTLLRVPIVFMYCPETPNPIGDAMD
ncbi:GNAT family N-acetyltransferase [Acaryochloris sp. IP29b_bin.137]|uniref:GNAT family N-acetyltransferase n=1 Tax=Acaryochloris sp. IP29b_bin.137 TaxID=2969217 RepID=UPI002608A773|nr:GNAT family N-acetyltransferase [Acaryochloris sp. IP29b_bin.137]